MGRNFGLLCLIWDGLYFLDHTLFELFFEEQVDIPRYKLQHFITKASFHMFLDFYLIQGITCFPMNFETFEWFCAVFDFCVMQFWFGFF